MKRVFLAIASVLVISTSAFAQDIFYPGFQLGIKGGAAYTSGEAAFTKLISPAAALDLGYQISPVFGLRADISGWQGKGWNVISESGYNFNFAQLAEYNIAQMLHSYSDALKLYTGFIISAISAVGSICVIISSMGLYAIGLSSRVSALTQVV